MSTRVAVYGGSFNPPHVAHVMLCTYLLSVAPVDRVLVVPVYHHVFDKQLAPFDVRVALCERAVGWIPGVEISVVERELEPPSYTLHTLQRLAASHPDWRMRLVLGSDVLHETHKWHEFARVQALAPVLAVGRAGHPHPDAPAAVLPEVSSTAIRELCARERSAAEQAELEALVPRAVLEMIAERGLYR